jgi:hypothetical protein
LPAGVYHRRRIGAVLAAVTLVAVGYLAVTGLLTVVGAGATPTHRPSVAAGGPASAVSRYYVVQPGDTLWSIARSLHPSGDIRPVVDRLEARAGGATLEAGQRLRVDGLGG